MSPLDLLAWPIYANHLIHQVRHSGDALVDSVRLSDKVWIDSAQHNSGMA